MAHAPHLSATTDNTHDNKGWAVIMGLYSEVLVSSVTHGVFLSLYTSATRQNFRPPPFQSACSLSSSCRLSPSPPPVDLCSLLRLYTFVVSFSCIPELYPPCLDLCLRNRPSSSALESASNFSPSSSPLRFLLRLCGFAFTSRISHSPTPLCLSLRPSIFSSSTSSPSPPPAPPFGFRHSILIYSSVYASQLAPPSLPLCFFSTPFSMLSSSPLPLILLLHPLLSACNSTPSSRLASPPLPLGLRFNPHLSTFASTPPLGPPLFSLFLLLQ